MNRSLCLVSDGNQHRICINMEAVIAPLRSYPRRVIICNEIGPFLGTMLVFLNQPTMPCRTYHKWRDVSKCFAHMLFLYLLKHRGISLPFLLGHFLERELRFCRSSSDEKYSRGTLEEPSDITRKCQCNIQQLQGMKNF